MNTQNDYMPVSNSMALAIRKDHRIMVIKNTSATIFRITWKTLLYAFILTIANVII